MPPITEPKKGKKNKKAKAPPKEREVVHKEVTVSLAKLNSDKCKELLDWTDENVTGEDYHLVDRDEKKVRLGRSTRNRPFSKSLADQYAQEHLSKRWRLNGETIVVDNYGEVASGQHRLASVILAEQDRKRNPHWEENWPGEVTMETVVVLGVDGSDEVVNTLDTGKPRSLGDVLYRSEHFAEYGEPKTRKTAARIADYCIRMLWHRTGADKDAFTPRRTHAESIAFIEGHLGIKRAVRHILTEDKEGNISAVLSPGYASAMLYLMSQGKTDPERYRTAAKEGVRSEKNLDFSLLDQAEEFWLLLGQAGSDIGKRIRDKVKELDKREDGDGSLIPCTLDEKMCLITHLWLGFVSGEAVRFPQHLDNDPPGLGGIDLGPNPVDDEEEPDVEEDEVEDAKEKIKEAAREENKKKLAEARAKKAEMAAATPPPNGKAQSLAEEIRKTFAKLKEGHDGKVLFQKSASTGNLATIDDDAERVAKVLKEKVLRESGYTSFVVSRANVKETLTKLLKAKVKVVVAEKVLKGGVGNSEVKVTDYIG